MKWLLFIGMLISGQAFCQFAKPSAGTIKRFNSFHSAYVAARNIDVWLPEGYSSQKKYPVLYMQDGQMLFDSTINTSRHEWKVDETAGKLIRENTIRECIIVGIWNNPGLRNAEYFPQKALSYLPKQTSSGVRTQIKSYLIGEPKADDYLKFIVLELKPFIDSSFSTNKEAASTYIAGSSMGALIALYAVCEYPSVFSAAACLSTHWVGPFWSNNNPLATALISYLNKQLPSPGDHRFYFDHGTAGLDNAYPQIQQQVNRLMKAKGYTSKNWISRVFPGADHSEKAWSQRLYIPLRFLLHHGE